MTTRTTLVAAVALVWLALGVYGPFSYGEAYNTYRGFPPPVDPVGVTPGHLFHEKFYSPALHQRRNFLVYTPPGYAAAVARGVRFPVLYLLHGSPGKPTQFINVAAAGVVLDTEIQRHQVRPFILVMPNGNDGTFRSETEWANSPHGKFEDLVIETMRTVDHRFATRRNRRFRAIAGNSEGGFGAVNISLHHLKLFSIAESWSGYGGQKRKGAFAHATDAQIYANSPVLYAPTLTAQLRRYPLHVYVYSGKSDKGLPLRQFLAGVLQGAGAGVKFAAFPGRHDWGVWRRETPRMIRYAGRQFWARPHPAHTKRLSRRLAAELGGRSGP